MKFITGWMTCKAGTRNEFLTAIAEAVKETQKEAGCVFFEFHPHGTDPDIAVLIEGFRDDEAHQFHRHTPQMAVMQTEMRRLVTMVRMCISDAEDDDVHWMSMDWIANPPGPWKP